jgi:drug/metabolite transporter (DMT)-like permease
VFTLACIALCVAGLLLVVTKGDLAGALNSDTWFGDLLLFGAALCWMVYTAGVARFAHWSPLRYTTLSGLSAAVVLLIATALAWAAGETAVPAWSEVGAVMPHMAFLVIVTAVVAGLAWNAGVRAIGALNALLLGNLVPVVTFSIRIAQGHHFLPVEFIGAGLVIVALAANNFYVRQRLGDA